MKEGIRIPGFPDPRPPEWSGDRLREGTRSVSRPSLHGMLAIATFFTLALAGGTFWEGVPEYFHQLRDPEVFWASLSAGARYAFWVFFILGAHEMGHYWACRFHGIPVSLPFFLPGIPPIGSFGAVIRIRGPIPHRRALFDVASAGPIAGFVVALPVLVVGMLQAEPFEAPPVDALALTWTLGEPMALIWISGLLELETNLEANSLIGAGWVGLLVTSLNLFPVGQLDGGHAAYALSRGLHRTLARATLVSLVGVVAIQVGKYHQFPPYLIWFAILLWMRGRHPMLLDETEPLGTARKAVACVLALIFVLSFTLMPIYVS